LSNNRLHLDQQRKQRDDLEARRKKAKDLGPDGHPIRAFFFNDAFTEMKGETPRWKEQSARTKGMQKISNRIFGIEVTCGPIDKVFLYHTDQFIAGGANTLIEVQRQAMADLAMLLKELGHPFPRVVNYQFDNCGENKNRFMFAYCSKLVEDGDLDVIYLDFLVVGHTHSTIDQYFSALANAIRGTKFIGSPQALWHLFDELDEAVRPAVNRKIEVSSNFNLVYHNVLYKLTS